jgi:hypothetical protein
VSSEHSSSEFVDPNARLLASVVPPPPPTLRARVAGFVSTRNSGDVRRIVRWSRSREGRSCFIAAIAGVALTLGFYRSEASSAASAGPALAPQVGREATPLVGGPNVHSEPLALTPTSTVANPPEPARAAANVPSTAAASDAVGDTAPEAALADADGTERPTPRKAASSKSHGKKATKAARRAKRQSVAKGSSRNPRRVKAQRATSAGPLAAWLATQRSKEASASKLR